MSADVTKDSGYFAQIPEWILDGASSHGVKLWAVLSRYADQSSKFAHPSRTTLAKRLRFKKADSVDPIIRELVEMGALTVVKRFTDAGDQDSNGYHLHLVPPTGPREAPHHSAGVGGPLYGGTGTPVAGGTVPPRNGYEPEPLEPEPLEPERAPKGAHPTGLAPASPTRGTRIAPDFAPTAELLAWAATSRPDIDAAAETEKFIDFWTAKAGRDAAKRDWPATWRNWIRNARPGPTATARGRPLSRAEQAMHDLRTRQTTERPTHDDHPRADRRALDRGRAAGLSLFDE